MGMLIVPPQILLEEPSESAQNHLGPLILKEDHLPLVIENQTLF